MSLSYQTIIQHINLLIVYVCMFVLSIDCVLVYVCVCVSTKMLQEYIVSYVLSLILCIHRGCSILTHKYESLPLFVILASETFFVYPIDRPEVKGRLINLKVLNIACTQVHGLLNFEFQRSKSRAGLVKFYKLRKFGILVVEVCSFLQNTQTFIHRSQPMLQQCSLDSRYSVYLMQDLYISALKTNTKQIRN